MLGSNICARNAVDTVLRSTPFLPEGKYTREGREGNGARERGGGKSIKKKHYTNYGIVLILLSIYAF